MDSAPQDEGLVELTQEEQLFMRLQPASEFEERLARHIAVCKAKLDDIGSRLTKARGQLQATYEELDLQLRP